MCPLGFVLLGWERHTLGVFICMGHLVSVGSHSTGLGKTHVGSVHMYGSFGVRWDSCYWVGKGTALGSVHGGTSWEC